MAEPPPSYLAALEALRAAFARELPDRLAELHAIWRDRPLPERIPALKTAAHKLAGSAGTFGFAEAGKAARELEVLLTNLPAGSSPEQADLAAEVPRRLDAIQALALATNPRPVEAILPPEEQAKLHFWLADPGLCTEWDAQLRAFGFDLQFHPSPAALREALRKGQPTLVVLDDRAPDGGPVDLGSFQRIQETLPKPVPMVVLGEDTGFEARLQSVRAGARAYLTKPVDFFVLLDVLEEQTLLRKQDPIHVLIIEDDPVLGQNHALVLQQAGMEATILTDPMRAMQPLVDLRPDLILLDLHMPGCSGLELAAVIRQQDAFVGIPIVFLSGDIARGQQLAALRLGADDYLTKPIPPLELVQLVMVRAQRGRRLRSFMVRDSLTGLLNHSAIKDQLVRELSRAARTGDPVSLAMIDLDHFKQVNDIHGHPGGDRVLRSLSHMLQQRLRKSDIMGRYGGEEFAVVLPGTDGPKARTVMEALRSSFAGVHFPFEREPRGVTLSCGIASFPAHPDAASLTEAADQALYRAKAGGRNQVVLAD